MKEKIYSIGIDVSKKTLDICFLGSNLKTIKEFKVINDNTGIQKIESYLTDYTLDQSASFLLESTGSYHLLSALLLQEKGYSIKVFNPILSSKYAKASIRKCKTDKIDAKRIAEIGILEELPEFTTTKKSFSLKRNVSTLQTLTQQKQVLKASLLQIKEDCLVLKIKLSKSQESMEKTLKELTKTIKLIEKEIIEKAKDLNGFNTISNIEGISKKSTGIILSQLHDKNFTSRESIAAFAGLDVSVKQSGTSIKGNGKISKRGNTMLRKTLTQVAWGLRMHNQKFQELAEYYKQKGKHYFEIMTILARKLLHVIYGMLKNNSHFDPAKIIIPKVSV